MHSAQMSAKRLCAMPITRGVYVYGFDRHTGTLCMRGRGTNGSQIPCYCDNILLRRQLRYPCSASPVPLTLTFFLNRSYLSKRSHIHEPKLVACPNLVSYLLHGSSPICDILIFPSLTSVRQLTRNIRHYFCVDDEYGAYEL